MSKESARASAEHRKAVVAAARKAEQRRRMLARLLVAAGIVVAVVVVAAIVFAVTRPTTATKASGTQIIPAGPTSNTVTQQAAVKRVVNTTGISGVLAWDTDGWPGDGTAHTGALQHDHVTGP